MATTPFANYGYPSNSGTHLAQDLPTMFKKPIQQAVESELNKDSDTSADSVVARLEAQLAAVRIVLGDKVSHAKPWVRTMQVGSDDFSAYRQGIRPGSTQKVGYARYGLKISTGRRFVARGSYRSKYMDPMFVILGPDEIEIRAASDEHRDELIAAVEHNVSKANEVIDKWNEDQLPKAIRDEFDRQVQSRAHIEARKAKLARDGFLPAEEHSPAPNQRLETNQAPTRPKKSPDRAPMELAIEEMKLTPDYPKVGAVITDHDGKVLSKGHRVEGRHAEAVALQNLTTSPDGMILYTTLEPCTRTASDCVQRIVDAGITTVVIGTYDLNPDIHRQGWTALSSANITLRDFDEDLRGRCKDVNADSELNYRIKEGPFNHGRFSYKTNDAGGKLTIRMSPTDPREIIVGFTECGDDSVYALASSPDEVALADGATELATIDDPSALRGFSHTVKVAKGEICVFKSEHVLVKMKIKKVDRATSSVTYKFEVLAR